MQAGYEHNRPLVSRRYDHATVFCCVPLRTAVCLTGLGCTLLGLAMLSSRASVQEDLRPLIGGYAPTSRSLIGLLTTSGILFGFIGAAGAIQMKASWLQLFLAYQVVRLLIWLPVYYMDLPLLWTCEVWMTNLQAAIHKFGWNDVIFHVALNNQCPTERSAFLTYSFPCFLFWLYCTSVTQQLLAEIETEPRHLLKDVVSGAFYTRSLATQSIARHMEEQEARRQQEKEAEEQARAHARPGPDRHHGQQGGPAAQPPQLHASQAFPELFDAPTPPQAYGNMSAPGGSRIFGSQTPGAVPGPSISPSQLGGGFAGSMGASSPMLGGAAGGSPFATSCAPPVVPTGGCSPPMPGPPRFPSAPAFLGGRQGAEGMHFDSSRPLVPGTGSAGWMPPTASGAWPPPPNTGCCQGGGTGSMPPVGASMGASMHPVHSGLFAMRTKPTEFVSEVL